jgi:hypothetical protein
MGLPRRVPVYDRSGNVVGLSQVAEIVAGSGWIPLYDVPGGPVVGYAQPTPTPVASSTLRGTLKPRTSGYTTSVRGEGVMVTNSPKPVVTTVPSLSKLEEPFVTET